MATTTQQIEAKERTGRYFAHSRGGDKNHPLLDQAEWRPDINRALTGVLPVNPIDRPMALCFDNPIPRKPVMADYHSSPHPIVSDKMKAVFEAIPVATAEFVPVVIQAPKQDYAYWRLHQLAMYDVIDRERSEYDQGSDGRLWWIDKLVIDYEKLVDIALQERLFFRLAGSSTQYLWHESLVDAVQAAQCSGIRFYPADNYGQDQMFDPS